MGVMVGHNKRKCPTPDSFKTREGALWQCECGQLWHLSYGFFETSRRWHRISRFRANRLQHKNVRNASGIHWGFVCETAFVATCLGVLVVIVTWFTR